jgi:hypothetical protein
MVHAMISPDSDQAVAECTRAQAETLVRFDHHRVRVADRWGIMITFPWMPLEEAQEPFLLKVIFNPAPTYLSTPDEVFTIVIKHPQAPEEVQNIIDKLAFQHVNE